ncbi:MULTISPECIES: N-acetyl-gamma-glutamyl-phosphate reductase [Solirubrobacterales]|uniref:N-acetyl-gamma-glutamyl-phosphate reductase n=1 Tax=Solirubrobacterales TaxID=588673 RepID=UPI001E5433A5|nr:MULTISPECIES: N-acetyl-gamma-glutamyl-phosphate reductase [Solirubrobacterales]
MADSLGRGPAGGGHVRSSGTPKRILVAGAAGFGGAITCALVHRHPGLELAAATARSDAGARLDEVYPHHRVPVVLEELDLDRHADGIDAAVVAYPHGASAPVVAGLRERGVPVVDFSADFRLRDLQTYERWYVPHVAPQLLEEAVYGLPELYRDELRGAGLIANPGCFPTAALLALAPVARAGLVADVVIDAKTGVSGAGRGASWRTHFSRVDENVDAYGIDGHRHLPEIQQELGVLGATAPVTFIPHLLPLDQGELVSCYVTTSRPVTQADVDELFATAYDAEPFVEVVATSPGVRDVRDTNYARLTARADERTGKVLVFCAIDNVYKGAASQAVQNLNLALGLPETAGLR